MLIATATLWAAAWSAFVIVAVWGEPWRGWVIGAALCAGVWSLILGAWWKPRVGGVVRGVVGVWAWTFFHSRASMLGLSLPALVLGVGFLCLGAVEARRARRQHQAAPPEPAGAASKPGESGNTPGSGVPPE